METLKKVFFIWNESKVNSFDFYKESITYFKEAGIQIIDDASLIDSSTFIITIGGDGTLLKGASLFITKDYLGVLAVNAGSLGFITEIKQKEAFSHYKHLLDGTYHLEKRGVLEVVWKNNCYYGINEAVVSKGGYQSQLIRVDINSSTDGFLSTYRGDGLIIATPTGSTAYSLSAGGPLVKPTIDALIITPIAPHNLTTRPIIIGGKEIITAKIREGEGLGELLIDGSLIGNPKPGEEIILFYSKKVLKLVIPENRNFYGVLREKLKWGDKIC